MGQRTFNLKLDLCILKVYIHAKIEDIARRHSRVTVSKEQIDAKTDASEDIISLTIAFGKYGHIVFQACNTGICLLVISDSFWLDQ